MAEQQGQKPSCRKLGRKMRGDAADIRRGNLYFPEKSG